jgi:aspartyl-tRNA(Asn)/glutamyl-tRNA(Gln) amidotransferase subunit A
VDTIATAGAKLRRGETSASALAEESLAAIARDNSRVNAFISVQDTRARSGARAIDDERARGVDRGPLDGIPISLKDLIDQQGIVTTAGSTVLDDRTPAADATAVARLREAGAIVIGRTNLHQFAVGTTSEDSHFGPVRNPADISRIAGGSSGGSAAAVATGMGLASIGTDTGGSIRIPAAACGVVGLKPSLGEVPTDGVIPVSTSLDHVGPLARTVQDAGWVCDVLAGRTPALIVPAPAGALRLARLIGYFDVLDAYVRASFEAALRRLQDRGAHVTNAQIAGADRIAPTYINLALPEAAAWHLPYLDSRAGQYVPSVHVRISQGRSISAIDYLSARAAAAALAVAVDRLLDTCDALLLPTLPIPAPPLGTTDIVIDPAAGGTTTVRAAMLRQTQLFNLTGHPAISIPVPASGLPVGVQLVGRRHATGRLLEIAAGCEAVFQS